MDAAALTTFVIAIVIVTVLAWRAFGGRTRSDWAVAAGSQWKSRHAFDTDAFPTCDSSPATMAG
jgi:hypothetical protein